MRSKNAVVVLALAVGAGFLIWCCGSPAAASDGATVAVAVTAIGAGEEAKHEYVGSKSCKLCHKDTYESWETTKHAKTLDLLKPGEAKEAKAKHKLDPEKDYTKDKECLGCHVTGWEKPGGYAIPDPEDKKAVKKAEKLAGVGCECCHGPGKDSNKVKKEIKKGGKEGKKYKFAQLEEAGMVKVSEKVCTGCHNEKGPTHIEGEKFDFKKMTEVEGGVHKHVPLKLREE